jgi:hypothetical protein
MNGSLRGNVEKIGPICPEENISPRTSSSPTSSPPNDFSIRVGSERSDNLARIYFKTSLFSDVNEDAIRIRHMKSAKRALGKKF